jgi:methionyl-tRNA formyltransferase
MQFNRILLVSDAQGLPALLDVLDPKKIVGVIIASIRDKLNPTLEKKINNLGIPIHVQPRIQSPEYPIFYESLRALKPDCLICHSYSMLIREDILKLVQLNAFNIHASYLPYNRGPNPIQWAIIHGDTYTGVTLHRMDVNFDTGNIIAQHKEPIYFDDTWVSLNKRLSSLTSKLIQNTLPNLLRGQFSDTPQPKTSMRKNTRLTSTSPQIHFETMTDLEIYNLIRAQVAPLKGAYVIDADGTHHYDSFIPLDRIEALRKKHINTCYATVDTIR